MTFRTGAGGFRCLLVNQMSVSMYTVFSHVYMTISYVSEGDKSRSVSKRTLSHKLFMQKLTVVTELYNLL